MLFIMCTAIYSVSPHTVVARTVRIVYEFVGVAEIMKCMLRMTGAGVGTHTHRECRRVQVSLMDATKMSTR